MSYRIISTPAPLTAFGARRKDSHDLLEAGDARACVLNVANAGAKLCRLLMFGRVVFSLLRCGREVFKSAPTSMAAPSAGASLSNWSRRGSVRRQRAVLAACVALLVLLAGRGLRGRSWSVPLACGIRRGILRVPHGSVASGREESPGQAQPRRRSSGCAGGDARLSCCGLQEDCSSPLDEAVFR